MRYAIISDIHGNLEALSTVIDECRRLKVDSVCCAGDIVGYGADPKRCLDKVNELKIFSVAGNHDWAVSGKLDFSYFTRDGQSAVLWTRTQITPEDITRLNSLPLVLKNKDCVLVHATLKNPDEFVYLTGASLAADCFEQMEEKICFVGHTHVPRVFIECQGKVYESASLNTGIDPECRYIINAGSVGQPRDGDPRASFYTFDTQLRTVENHRVPYDINRAQQKILAAGLPQNLALRLAKGR